jgi:hypothetical protein
MSTLTGPLNQAYQQAGLLLYQDDDNYLTLMQVYSDSYAIEYRGEIDGRAVEPSSTSLLAWLPIKLARRGDTVRAYYSTDNLTWKPLGQSVVVNWPDARIGLAAFDPLGGQERAAFFDWFRVRPGCVRVTIHISPVDGGAVAQSPQDCDGGLGYSAGLTVTLTALPGPGYRFDEWTGGVKSAANPIDVVVAQDMTVTARFSRTYTQFLPIILRLSD